MHELLHWNSGRQDLVTALGAYRASRHASRLYLMETNHASMSVLIAEPSRMVRLPEPSRNLQVTHRTAAFPHKGKRAGSEHDPRRADGRCCSRPELHAEGKLRNGFDEQLGAHRV